MIETLEAPKEYVGSKEVPLSIEKRPESALDRLKGYYSRVRENLRKKRDIEKALPEERTPEVRQLLTELEVSADVSNEIITQTSQAMEPEPKERAPSVLFQKKSAHKR